MIYFIRHAQAGTRENYDVLSDLGREQARRLGEYFLEQGAQLEAVYAGGMIRQRETAEIACSVMSEAGLAAKEVTIDERWNEFSLASVYRAIARRMMQDSEEFRRDIAEMQEALRRDPHTTRGATGRCDAAVIRAWIENRYPDFEGETWASFSARIKACISDLISGQSADDRGMAIAVFTSATPIAIATALSLDLSDEKLVSILGVLYNTSTTVMRARPEGLRLFTFNQAPHLNGSNRTFR
ncbi:MAG TPA: histidine phosphatase family protein [Blastocatellia bacterium]|nr:histidine phosphatase family protein [Blastocatellia bacterium]